MLRGPSFRLFGIPTRIELWFLLTGLFFALASRRSGWWLLEFVVVLTVAVLVHELGHAFAYRRYGQHPSIVLTSLAGLTYGERPLPPGKRIVVSLAGSFTQIVVLGAPAWIALELLSPTTSYVLLQVLSDVKFLALVWALVNLLPMQPLDGGNVLEAVLEARSGDPHRQVVRIVSIVTGVGFGIFAKVAWNSDFGMIFGFVIAFYNLMQYLQVRNGTGFVFDLDPGHGDGYGGGTPDNVVSMGKERRKRDRRSRADLAQDAWTALDRRDYRGVQRLAGRLQDKRLSGDAQAEAAELAAWGWLGLGNPVKAEEAVGHLPRGRRPSRALSASLLLASNRTDDALRLMVDVMVNGPAGPARLAAVDLFAERGMTHRLARELVDLEGGSGFEAAVGLEGMLHQLHRTQDASTVSDVILLG